MIARAAMLALILVEVFLAVWMLWAANPIYIVGMI